MIRHTENRGIGPARNTGVARQRHGDRPGMRRLADDWDVHVESRDVTFDLLSGRLGDTPGAVATTEDELVRLFAERAFPPPG